MKLYLVGYPVEHSISPAFQVAALRACGLDWSYERLQVRADGLAGLAALLRSPECAGANVTIPHKQAIIPLLDEVSAAAAEIGAVNTIVHRGERLIGDNTDAAGFLYALKANGFGPEGATGAIIGAGGAAAAVAYTLGRAGAEKILLLNRTTDRAERLRLRLSRVVPCPIIVADWASLALADLLVNATPVGMWPHTSASPLLPGAKLKGGAVAFDLVYNPPETRFMGEAAATGAKAISGLDMLLGQGALSFQLWTGQTAPMEVMRGAALEAIKTGGGG